MFLRAMHQERPTERKAPLNGRKGTRIGMRAVIHEIVLFCMESDKYH